MSFYEYFRGKQSVWSALFIIDVRDLLHAHSARDSQAVHEIFIKKNIFY